MPALWRTTAWANSVSPGPGVAVPSRVADATLAARPTSKGLRVFEAQEGDPDGLEVNGASWDGRPETHSGGGVEDVELESA